MPQLRINEEQSSQADVFRALLDNFPDMIHSVDTDGNLVYANRTAEKLLGYTHDELLAMNIRQLYADEILDAVQAGFADLKRKGSKSVESLLKAKDGTRIPVEIRSFSIYDDDGRFLRTFSILRDIRQIKELQKSLVHAGRLAAIGELASGVAHDINNPLTVVVLSAECMVRTLNEQTGTGDGRPRLLRHANDVAKAARSIEKISNHLRDFSRGMAEKHTSLDLYDPISDAIFITSARLRQSNVTVQNSVRKGHYFVSGLRNQLEQVFMNLISNACDAMLDAPRRLLTLSITPASHKGADCWRCDVTDTGSGIPPDKLQDIFRSFYTTKESGKGTGLGLSLSRGIIRDHGGMIEVNSTLGQGTTFSVLLPACPPDE